MRLDMVRRVLALCQQHPTTVPGYVDAVKELGERLARAEALATQQETGDNQAGALVVRKTNLRRTMESDYLQHLVRIARASLPDDPELVSRFRMPRPRLNRQAFVAAVRAILAEASSRQALFISQGMPETFVAELEGVLEQYLEAVSGKALGEAQRVGAVAELPEVTKALMQVVRRLDSINRKRWQKNPELLAAWLSAKDVTWPHPKAAEPSVGSGGAAGGKEDAA